MSIPATIQNKLEDQLKIKVSETRSLGGGCSFPSYQITAEGRSLFLKVAPNPSEVFIKEANGLKALKQAGAQTPEVQAVDLDYLVLQYIEPETPTDKFWQDLGKNLAQVHNHKGEGFGFFENNFIGRSQQINLISQASISWSDFFWKYRIKQQFEWVEKNRGFALPRGVVAALESTIRETLNQHQPFPSPVHGDLWNGNVHCGAGQVGYIIDPAFYYGDREVDLAMTELFGGFPQSFYEPYNQHFPLPPDYQIRKTIYNLYHLLNHLLLFGSTYVGAVETSINKIIKG